MDVNAAQPDVPMMNGPSIDEAEHAVRDARVLFARTLAAWSSDLLVLRRASRLRPTWTTADDEGGPALAA